MSEIFAKWIAEVVCANGIKAKITDCSVPSPLISFANKLFGNDISIMVTASHNPYYYNGIKIFSKEGQDLELYLEKMYKKKLKYVKKYKSLDFDLALNNNLLEYCNLNKAYVDSIISLLRNKNFSNCKVMFNVLNGSSLECVNQLKKKIKVNLEIVGEERDVLFNNKGPIPNEDNLESYKKYALSKKVNFAFATDGDGDRIAMFDEKGNYYNGNEIATLIYFYCIKERGLKGAFVKNYSFSLLADKVCSYLNTDIIETPVGFKYIGEQIIKNNALLGAENSGCEIAKHTYTKDGLVVFALILEIVDYYKKPLSQIIFDMKKEVGYNLFYKEESFKVKDKKKVIQFLNKNTPNFKKHILLKGNLDGYKYIFDDQTWILIRFSGTENLIRIVCEQKSKMETSKMIKLTKQIINEI